METHSKWKKVKQIPVLNDLLSQILKCMHDVIQEKQIYTAYCKNKYTCILLEKLILFLIFFDLVYPIFNQNMS